MENSKRIVEVANLPGNSTCFDCGALYVILDIDISFQKRQLFVA
jgi:hypothetical protein